MNEMLDRPHADHCFKVERRFLLDINSNSRVFFEVVAVRVIYSPAVQQATSLNRIAKYPIPVFDLKAKHVSGDKPI